MPWRQSRSGTGLGPGDRSGQGGRSGSISAHKLSSTIHGRVLTPSRTAESSDRSRPTSAFHQDRVMGSTDEAVPDRPATDRVQRPVSTSFTTAERLSTGKETRDGSGRV